MNAHDRLIGLQRKIYRSLEEDVKRRLGPTPPAIRRYEKEYQKDFRLPRDSELKSVSKTELIKTIRESRVTYVADFHTFAQAQRTALRIMREAVRPGEKWLIGLELISSQYQAELDAFMSGNLSLEDFLKAIDYDHDWGFPWGNYEPLFKWGRSIKNKSESKLRFIALNSPKAFPLTQGHQELQKRDRWAAGIITDRMTEDPDARMIVLYGELHLSSTHLPRQVQKISQIFAGAPIPSVTIHQNHDRLYWKLAKTGGEHGTSALRLRKNVFCVFSSPPWTKLQSVVTWAEGGESSAISGSLSDVDGESGDTDYLSLMSGFANTVADFLDVPAPSFDSVHVVSIEQAEFSDSINRLLKTSSLRRPEQALIKHLVGHGHRFYLSKPAIAYLGSPTANRAAELAAIHLMRTVTRDLTFLDGTENPFYRMALDSAFGFLGSLILNPKRKCDLSEDHRRRIKSLSAGAKPVYPFELDARKTALAAMDGADRTLSLKLKAIRRAPAIAIAARMAGHALGQQIHRAVLENRLTTTELRDFFLRPVRREKRLPSERFHELKAAVKRAKLAGTKLEQL